MLSDINEILEYDKMVQKLLTLKDMHILPGSVLRVPAYAYANWGIQITPQNLTALYYLSKNAYSVEWEDTDESLNALVGKASKRAGLGDVNANMNEFIGNIVVKYIKQITQTQERVVVLDVGAGAGATSIALINALQRYPDGHELASRIDFVLVEPSKKRLSTGVDLLEKAGIVYTSIDPQACKDVDMQVDDESVDIVISNASIHHNAFNYHLNVISRAMKKGALFVNGDWNTDVWHDPLKLVLDMYKEFTSDICSFIQEFGSSTKNKRIIQIGRLLESEINQRLIGQDKLIDQEEIGFESNLISQNNVLPAMYLADKQIIKFWISVNDVFREESEKRGEHIMAPIYFLEAHEPIPKRMKNLNAAGIETDPVKVRMAFNNKSKNKNTRFGQGFRHESGQKFRQEFGQKLKHGNVTKMLPNSNLAAVMIGYKR